jgi:hypothetical protein
MLERGRGAGKPGSRGPRSRNWVPGVRTNCPKHRQTETQARAKRGCGGWVAKAHSRERRGEKVRTQERRAHNSCSCIRRLTPSSFNCGGKLSVQAGERTNQTPRGTRLAPSFFQTRMRRARRRRARSRLHSLCCCTTYASPIRSPSTFRSAKRETP